MMNANLSRFYKNWTNKCEQIKGNTIADTFDRFTTMFIPYNALYNEIPVMNRLHGIPVANRLLDSVCATTDVVLYLGVDDLLNELVAKNNDDINEFEHILRFRRFFIRLKKNNGHRPYDLALLNELQSANNETKATAILKFVYYVRCNIFHGNKNFEEVQSQVVEPVTRVLSTVINLLYNKLEQDH